jgi:tetratricopeptide (TPR) repeat protein
MIRPILVTFAMLLIYAGCALPRFTILTDPLSPEEHLDLGIAYEKSGEFDNAIQEYTAAAKKYPVALLYLGNAHFQKNEWDVAEKYYRRAIKKQAHNADAYNNLAWLYYVQGKNLDEAESLVLRAMELNPSQSYTYKDTLERIRELENSLR